MTLTRKREQEDLCAKLFVYVRLNGRVLSLKVYPNLFDALP